MRHINQALGDMDEFRKALNGFHAETSSWREVGLALGKSASYAMRVARGDFNPSQEALSSWRHFMTGKAPQFRIVEACPSCGGAHGDKLDCHNRPIAQVVILSPDERVYRRKSAQRWADMPIVELKRAIENRQPYKGRSAFMLDTEVEADK